jgi:DNA-binding response OmpR family regulator
MSKTILVVDDEPGIVEIVRVNLEAEGYHILTAPDGAEGLEIIRDRRPDLVILDVMMPRMSGWEVLRHIEADLNTAGLPVIMLTVKAGTMDIVRGLEQGAVEYITKPFDPMDLVERVHFVLEQTDARGRDAHRRQLMERRRRFAKPLQDLF